MFLCQASQLGGLVVVSGVIVRLSLRNPTFHQAGDFLGNADLVARSERKFMSIFADGVTERYDLVTADQGGDLGSMKQAASASSDEIERLPTQER